jgi:hypothetical protein
VTRIGNLLNEISSALKRDSKQDILDWVSRFAFDFMGDMAFGGGFELTKNGDPDDYFGLIEGVQRMSVYIGQIAEAGSFALYHFL